MKKSFLKVIMVALSVVCLFTLLTGCSSSKEFVFEAEYTDLTGIKGMGLSSSANDVSMIIGRITETPTPQASNEHYVGFLNGADIALTFKINSDKAAEVDMSVRFGNELGTTIKWNPTALKITVNGTAVEYTEFKVSGNPGVDTVFKDYAISPKISLTAGENVIVFTVLENSYYTGSDAGGPLFDCIKIKTDAKLTWTAMTSNLDRE